MLWFTLALMTAFLNATEAALIKRWLSDLRPLELTAIPFLFLIPYAATGLAVVPWPELEPGFWPLMALLLPINTLAVLLHFRAIKISPLSLTMPMMSFTPAFVLLTGFLFLGETVRWLGALGVAAIVVGGYALGREGRDRSLTGPVRALARERGSLYMLGAAFLYAFCSVMGKSLLLKSAPVFFACLFFTVFGVALNAGLLALGLVRPRVLLSRPLAGAVIGGTIFLHLICHHLAIALVQAAYMMAIKRLNGVFSVLYGWLMFREVDIRNRLAGAGLMALGAAVIALWG